MHRNSAFVYEGEHNVTSSPTATTRNYAFLLQCPIVAAAALTRLTLNAAAYNKHPTANYKDDATYTSEQNETNTASKINREVGLDESPGISKATSATYSYKITSTTDRFKWTKF
jgi:hypothetical protein